MIKRAAAHSGLERAERDGTEPAARDRVRLWLDCRLGERVNVEVGGAWALEARGELRGHWRRVAGLYRVGDAGLLDLNDVGETVRVFESGAYPGAEQIVVELDSGIVLTVTVEE